MRPLLRSMAMLTDIESFWRDPDQQQSPAWTAHRDINDVMLATALVPEGFLVLREPESGRAGR